MNRSAESRRREGHAPTEGLSKAAENKDYTGTGTKSRTVADDDGSERLMMGGVILAEKPARRKRRRQDWAFSIELLRLREIEALIAHRHGRIPDPDGTDDRETCLAYVRAAAMALSGQDMGQWCRMWAPWAREADLVPILSDTVTRRRMMRADGVARLLSVTMAERTALGLKTIGAADMTKAERQAVARAKKLARDRERRLQARRGEGRQDRESYVAQSLQASKPWETEGISRASWYRRQRETGVSRVEVYRKSDALVSSPDLPGHEHVGVRAARGDRGLGTVSPTGLQGAAPHGSGDVETTSPALGRNAA